MKEDSVYERLSDETTIVNRKEQPQNCTVELKTETSNSEASPLMLMNSTAMLQEIISVMKFSCYKKSLGIVVCVLIFIANCKGKTEEKGDTASSSQLSDLHITTEYLFEALGIGFAGPLFVNSKSKGARKVDLTLFTCARTKAVHLEIVRDLLLRLSCSVLKDS